MCEAFYGQQADLFIVTLPIIHTRNLVTFSMNTAKRKSIHKQVKTEGTKTDKLHNGTMGKGFIFYVHVSLHRARDSILTPGTPSTQST